MKKLWLCKTEVQNGCVKYSILVSKNNHILNVICSIYLSKDGNSGGGGGAPQNLMGGLSQNMGGAWGSLK